MKKIAVYSLVGLFILSCSVSPPNNTNQDTSSPSLVTRHPSLIKDNFSDLEKDYKSFSTKALSDAYVSRMFTKFLVTTPNSTQIIRQLEFARYLKDIKSDSSYFNSLTGIISNDSTIYTKINTMPEIVSYKTANPATFGTFVESLSPPPTNIIYVKSDATGLNNGTNWANAYNSLQDALNNATSGKDIWIATGTYKPTSGTERYATFQLKSGVNVYGGFSGIETQLSQRNWNTNVVTLSGDLNNSGAANNGDSYHVVTGSNNAILDGVTVKFGFANGSSPEDKGGGMYNYGTSPRINNCIFTSNSSSYFAGALYNYDNAPVITNTEFISNSTAIRGGAIYNNYSASTFSSCSFKNNFTVSGSAGAMYNNNFFGSLAVSIVKSIFVNNSAMSGHGGAISNEYTSPTISNSIFISNTASNSGGAISNYNPGLSSIKATIKNCTFISNSAANGGVMFNYYSSTKIINSILWGNSASVSEPNIINNNATPDITYSNIEGGYTGTGNINSTPLFVNMADPDGADNKYWTADDGLALQSGSPSVNTGTATEAPETDFINTTRPKGSGFDMGAYEFVE